MPALLCPRCPLSPPDQLSCCSKLLNCPVLPHCRTHVIAQTALATNAVCGYPRCVGRPRLRDELRAARKHGKGRTCPDVGREGAPLRSFSRRGPAAMSAMTTRGTWLVAPAPNQGVGPRPAAQSECAASEASSLDLRRCPAPLEAASPQAPCRCPPQSHCCCGASARWPFWRLCFAQVGGGRPALATRVLRFLTAGWVVPAHGLHAPVPSHLPAPRGSLAPCSLRSPHTLMEGDHATTNWVCPSDADGATWLLRPRPRPACPASAAARAAGLPPAVAATCTDEWRGEACSVGPLPLHSNLCCPLLICSTLSCTATHIVRAAAATAMLLAQRALLACRPAQVLGRLPCGLLRYRQVEAARRQRTAALRAGEARVQKE